MLGLGCTELPATHAADDLVALGLRYEHPSAMVPGEFVRELLGLASESSELARELDGLRVIHGAVADAASRLAKEGDADGIELQGTVEVVHVCPGYESEPTTDVAVGGAIHLTFNVERSLVLRGLQGRAEGCRFAVNEDGGETRVKLDAALTIDLGDDIRIGTRLGPKLLLRLRELSAAVARDASSELRVYRDQYHFRLDDERIETLIDLAELGFSQRGSAVVVIKPDGALALRERRGEWTCESTAACELKALR